MATAPQPDHIRFLFDPRTSLSAYTGQRRRFAHAVEGLSADELAAPSRCANWSVADVLRHLVWVDRTAASMWSGDETIADGFDPRTTPDDAVRADREVSDEEVRALYLRSTETMVADLDSSAPERFGRPSLSPAGRVPWWLSALHMAWDSSIHERDALLPLGREVEPDPSETSLYLGYSLVLTSFFAGHDPLAIRVGEIDLRRGTGPVTVRMAGTPGGEDDTDVQPATVTTDDPVKAIDALSGRGPIEASLRGDSEALRRLGGLARFFAGTTA